MPSLHYSEWALPRWVLRRESGRVHRDALTPQLVYPRSGADHHRYGFELPARVEFVASARKLARRRLHHWGIEGDVHDAAMLVVSELVTNAVVHTDGHRVACELLNGAERLRITVQDQGSAPTGPHVCHTFEEERGRGLLLVEAVSGAWGSHDSHVGPGRIVWAELPHEEELPYGTEVPYWAERPC
ncbi:ATP-binding protein [Streptomyces lunaelactis]|uniref:ATP-binding protein n=1 Tax=Streptomyces lunaelactis TaxID=1535768 RepID=A0A2R4TBD4_9ACTN|nr:ATP-binding protein [Streptomyces lunaelactis]NUK89004.1 ATP-binding protein [Streptomyces lunaelactis]